MLIARQLMDLPRHLRAGLFSVQSCSAIQRLAWCSSHSRPDPTAERGPRASGVSPHRLHILYAPSDRFSCCPGAPVRLCKPAAAAGSAAQWSIGWVSPGPPDGRDSAAYPIPPAAGPCPSCAACALPAATGGGGRDSQVRESGHSHRITFVPSS